QFLSVARPRAMSIAFQCDCGKRLSARDEFAGRRTKCPACGVIATIPNSAVATAPKPRPSKETIVGKSSDTQLASPKSTAIRPTAKPIPAAQKKNPKQELPKVLPANADEQDFEIIEDEQDFEVIEDEPEFEVIEDEDQIIVVEDEEEKRPPKKDRPSKSRKKK